MPSPEEIDAWAIDQLTKSEFFHQKLHEWGLLEVAYQIEQIQGESLNWDLPELGISESAWNKIIHRPIKPVTVFAHPEVIMNLNRAVGYYRMMAMVSQKSMKRIRLNTDNFESGKSVPDQTVAGQLAQHLNQIISQLVEADELIDKREFDLWRGMAAGSQAQGSWQNTKGSRTEIIIKGILRRRLQSRHWLMEPDNEEQSMKLIDDRVVKFADEPDVGIYQGETILAAIEIKGGIDTAGVLERIGAALKSLQRAKEENPDSTTILILQGVSMSSQAVSDLKTNQNTINHWFTVEEVLNDESRRETLFNLLNI